MDDLVERLRKLANEVGDDEVREAADRIELNAVNYLVLDNDYQTALSRIEELEAWAIARDNEQGRKIEKLNNRISHLESALKRLGDPKYTEWSYETWSTGEGSESFDFDTWAKIKIQDFANKALEGK